MPNPRRETDRRNRARTAAIAAGLAALLLVGVAAPGCKGGGGRTPPPPPPPPPPTGNRAPVFAGTIGDRTVLEGATLAFVVSATDPEGGAVTLAAEGLPANATFAPSTGAFEFRPDLTQAGTYAVTFRATDAGSPPETATQTVSIAVRDLAPPTIVLTSPANGSLTRVAQATVAGMVSDPAAGPGAPAPVVTLELNGAAPRPVAVQAGAFGETVGLAEGPNTIRVAAANAAGTGAAAVVSVTLDTVAPPLAIETPADGAIVFTDTVRVAGTCDDPAAAIAVNGIQALRAGRAWEVAALPLATPGPAGITVTATDAAGNVSTRAIAIERRPNVVERIEVAPGGARLTAAGATLALAVVGHLSDGVSTRDLTAPAAGTTYETSNAFVATVGPDGACTAVANGAATITARNGAFAASATVVVEVGVTCQTLAVAPRSVTLRAVGATRQLTVTGTFSDGSTRDLTGGASGIAYTSNDPRVATVTADGLIAAVAPGAAMVTARCEGLAADAQVTVAVASAPGFVRGEVYDDALGLPLAGAAVTLLEDGGGPPATPRTTATDAAGRYVASGLDGATVLRMERPGYTTVERAGAIPRDRAAVLLDARLTPLDPRRTAIASATGGRARNEAGTVTLDLAAGALATDTEVALTAVSPQGLAGALPLGWSPAAAVDVAPRGPAFGSPAELRVANAAGLPAGTDVAAAIYDLDAHVWRATAPARVSDDGREIVVAALAGPGQVAILVPDATPLAAPPAPVAGEPLEGVASVPPPAPADLVATGSVTPRSAPAGPDARGTGRLTLRATSGAPLPSGTVLEARVRERFDLRDASVVTPPETGQDIVLFAFPPPADAAAAAANGLAATFKVTPSRAFAAHELALGAVRIAGQAPGAATTGAAIGAAGGTVASGDVRVDVPAGALGEDTLVDLLALAAADLPSALPAGLTLHGAARLDLAGARLAASAALSSPAPSALPAGAQVLVARAFADLSGISRLEIVAAAEVQAGRLVSRPSIGAVALAGIVEGGVYVLVEPAVPLGFVTGTVAAPGGAGSPQPLALVTADTAPFADLTDAAGRYLVAGAVGEVAIVVLDEASGDAAAAAATIAARDEVVALDIALALVPPAVVAISPAADARNVPLDTSIRVVFSEPVVESSVTPASFAVTATATGAPVPGSVAVAPDGRSATFTPAAPLASTTGYTVALGAPIVDLAGRGLAAFAPTSFTTLDTSKPPQPPAGQITAGLPDADGIVLIFGTRGTAEPQSGVTVTNLATQETYTALAQADGHFRLRIRVTLGDELALTFRDAASREVTVAITQLEGEDGTTALAAAGGIVRGPGGRLGRVLPRALRAPALFRLTDAADPAARPALPADVAYADGFDLALSGGPFRALRSLALAESQGRLDAPVATLPPFATTGTIVVPFDFLVNGSLRFTATAEDEAAVREAASGATLVVAASPSGTRRAGSFETRFPTVFIDFPAEAIPGRQLEIRAEAPAARLEIELDEPAGLDAAASLLLVRIVEVQGARRLAVVDRLARRTVDGAPRLATAGREHPGATAAGAYAVVAVGPARPIAFITGRIAGPAAVVSVDGSPFVFATDGPNGAFRLPVDAGAPFALTFVDAATGLALGTASGQAPAAAGDTLDIGSPLAPPGAALAVTAVPDASSLPDIADPIVFTFSEPVDARTVGASTLIVTGPNGVRIPGRFAVATDGLRAAFAPARRFRYGTAYRYVVTTGVLAVSGARLAQPFEGTFTTFAPRTIAQAEVDEARDVALSGDVVLVGGASGLTVVDVGDAARPSVLARVPEAAGVGAVAFSSPSPSPTALVAAGDGATGASLRVIDLATPGAPAVVASAALRAGTPSGVAGLGGGRAVVSIRGAGAEIVDLTTTMSGPRYPATGAETVNGAAALTDRVLLLAGAAGLTTVDATDLATIGVASTQGEARAVAALAAFPIDLDGDGAIDALREIFDLAVIANGADGTLQLYDLRDPAAPRRIAVVRLRGEARAVALDRDLALAYVAGGAAGVSIVDLRGPQGIQPIDVDRDGADDRILATVATRGAASRIALDLGRGVGHVADGSRGLAVLALLPPSARFADLRRDPIAAAVGDEESILETGEALDTDQAIRVVVDATIPPAATLSLALDEVPGTDGSRLFSLPGGATAAPLAPGRNELTIGILAVAPRREARAAFVVRDGDGRRLAGIEVRLAPSDPGGAALEALFLAPDPAVLADPGLEIRLAAGGVFSDGRVRNLTDAAAGTTYFIPDTEIATVAENGLVTGRAGGLATVFARNAGRDARGTVEVGGAPALRAIRVSPGIVTLRGVGAQQPLAVIGLFTSGREGDVTRGAGAVFASSDAAVVVVDGEGRLTAAGAGAADVTVTAGAFTASARVAVEPFTPPSVTAIDVAPFAAPISLDRGEALARAVAQGTGSLEGLPVTVTVDGQALPDDAITSYGGELLVRIAPLPSPGLHAIGFAILDPASGATRTDAEMLTVLAGTGDNEPNGDPAAASPLGAGRTVAGSLDAATDASDAFRLEAATDGTLTLTLTLAAGTPPAAVIVRVLDESGAEVAVFTPASVAETFTVAGASGRAIVVVEAAPGAGAATTYELAASIEPDPLTIASVAPASGGPGTPVTIAGTGFSRVPAENLVLFGGVMARVVSASPAALVAVVPAGARTGPLQVVVGSGQARVASFDTGSTGPAPGLFLTPADPAMTRLDPLTGALLTVNRLLVLLASDIDRAGADALATAFGASVAGFLPMFNTYILDFPAVSTVADLEAVRRQLESDPRVVSAERNTHYPDHALTLDIRDNPGTWAPGNTVSRGNAYERAKVQDAIRVVRDHPRFAASPAPFHDVTVAIIDSGFNPALLQEFRDTTSNQLVVRLYDAAAPATSAQTGFLLEAQALADPNGHGTNVASVIAAVNDGNPGLSGVLNSLVLPGEPAFKVLMYARGASRDGIAVALEDVCNRTRLLLPGPSGDGPIDVLNLSFGSQYAPSDIFVKRSDETLYRRYFQVLEPTTLIVKSAGNKGADAALDVPSSLVLERPNVMVIGATAVDDLDGTGETADRRAIYGPSGASTLSSFYPLDRQCDRPNQESSNGGNAVSLAAPGEEVFEASTTATNASGYETAARSQGTSVAAPMVAGVAAMLQAIRPAGAAPFTPVQLKALLIETGDDITEDWRQSDRLRTVPIRRLNALNAVLRVLGPATPQPVFIADQEGQIEGEPGLLPGKLVAIEVDPLTGQRVGLVDRTIPLAIGPVGARTFFGTAPTAVAVSPLGNELYVVCESFSPALGHGVLVVSTASLTPQAFIAFSGETAPATPGAAGSPAGRVFGLPSNRPGIVPTPDGRLLYVAIGTRIAIIDAERRRIVRELGDLPAAYQVGVTTQNRFTLGQRLNDLVPQAVLQPVPNDPLASNGEFIGRLALSPDGTTLFALVESGQGGGLQRGFVLPLDVDLYTDRLPSVRGLQADTTRYFTQKYGLLAMPAGTPVTGGDEPKSIAVSPDGKWLYMVHGGVEAFIGSTDLSAFNTFLATEIGQTSAPFSGGGAITAGQADAMREAFEAQAAAGQVFLAADGTVAIFDARTGAYEGSIFPNELAASWGFKVPPTPREPVHADRPFGFAFRPDGKRAILGFFQTGNFAVLDLDHQRRFATPPVPYPDAPDFLLLLPDRFHGAVGITKGIRLDRHLWPSRGAIDDREKFDKLIPSPDESRLFTGEVVYAQNGRFAVAVHAGTGAPRTIQAKVIELGDSIFAPIFGGEFLLSLRLADLAITVEGDSFRDVHDWVFAEGETAPFRRGGGAISIIRDEPISADLTANIGRSDIDRVGNPVSWFNVQPVGGDFQTFPEVAAEPAERFASANDAVTELFVHLEGTPGAAAGRPVSFHRPRGAAIQPYVWIEGPRFGDHVSRSTGIEARWRDPRVQGYELRIGDLDTLVPDPVDPTRMIPEAVGFDAGVLSAAETAGRELSRTFGDRVNPSRLRDRGRYRIEVILYTVASQPPPVNGVLQPLDLDGELSRTHIDVRYDATRASRPRPPCQSAIDHLAAAPQSLALPIGGTRNTTTVGYTLVLDPINGGDRLTSDVTLAALRGPRGLLPAVDIVPASIPLTSPAALGTTVVVTLRNPIGPDEELVRDGDEVTLELACETRECGRIARQVVVRIGTPTLTLTPEPSTVRYPYGGPQAETIVRYTIDLASADDPIQAGTQVEMRAVRQRDRELALEITREGTERRNGLTIQGAFRVRLRAAQAGERYPVEDFQLEVEFACDRSGIHRGRTLIDIADNIAGGRNAVRDTLFLEVPELTNVCQADASHLARFETRVRQRLIDRLGYDPFLDSQNLPADLFVVHTLPEGRILLRPVYSELQVQLNSTRVAVPPGRVYLRQGVLTRGVPNVSTQIVVSAFDDPNGGTDTRLCPDPTGNPMPHVSQFIFTLVIRWEQVEAE